MRFQGVMAAGLVAAGVAVAGAGASAQTAGPDWTALQAETLQHFQALLRLDTQNPAGNEYLVTDYLKAVLEKEGMAVQIVASGLMRLLTL